MLCPAAGAPEEENEVVRHERHAQMRQVLFATPPRTALQAMVHHPVTEDATLLGNPDNPPPTQPGSAPRDVVERRLQTSITVGIVVLSIRFECSLRGRHLPVPQGTGGLVRLLSPHRSWGRRPRHLGLSSQTGDVFD
eukprot:1191996-Prorocentrum_minimum.AAC.2